MELNEGSQICTGFDEYMQRNEDANFVYESMKYYKIWRYYLQYVIVGYMKEEIHRLVTVACYAPVNGDNETIRNEVWGKLCNILNEWN